MLFITRSNGSTNNVLTNNGSIRQFLLDIPIEPFCCIPGKEVINRITHATMFIHILKIVAESCGS